MPTGVLMPVASISMRFLIGITQALVRPGNWISSFSSFLSLSMVMPSRHSSCGLSRMVVSIMVSGAGSVALSARPTLPNTVFTSGTVLISLLVCCSSCSALPAETAGKALGIYSRSPSSSSGINSEPRCCSGHMPTMTSNRAPASTSFGECSTISISGL